MAFDFWTALNVLNLVKQLLMVERERNIYIRYENI